MHKARLEAFSDGVIAILITIMVLELKVPHEAGWDALKPLVPVFLSYVLSFLYLGIYWNNHHHLIQAAKTVSASVLWANLHLLFWLSLVPFTTGWMSESHFDAAGVALYGFVLLMAGLAYFILSQMLIRTHGRTSALAQAIGSDWKGVLSLVGYSAAILAAAFGSSEIALALYVLVAAAWLVPDRRLERAIK